MPVTSRNGRPAFVFRPICGRLLTPAEPYIELSYRGTLGYYAAIAQLRMFTKVRDYLLETNGLRVGQRCPKTEGGEAYWRRTKMESAMTTIRQLHHQTPGSNLQRTRFR